MSITERIAKKISTTYKTDDFMLVDDSARHHGHAGAAASDGTQGETHFKLTLISEAFAGVSRVERQRQIYALLKEEMDERVHALSLTLKAPGE